MRRLVRVSGESMAPTYRSSDLLLTRPAGRAGVRLRRADVVVFRHGELRMVKRVVGLPGDLVELEAGRLFVNGESVDRRPGVRGAYTQTWRVPEASYFMAGDNPTVSDDSRVWDEPFVRVESVESVVTRRLVGPRLPRGSHLVNELLQSVGLRYRDRTSRADHYQTLPGEVRQCPAEALGGGIEQGGHFLLGQREGDRGNAASRGTGQTEQVVG